MSERAPRELAAANGAQPPSTKVLTSRDLDVTDIGDGRAVTLTNPSYAIGAAIFTKRTSLPKSEISEDFLL